MNTNSEINQTTRTKAAILYSMMKRRRAVKRGVDETTFKSYLTPAMPTNAVLKIYDDYGREVLSIERNED